MPKPPIIVHIIFHPASNDGHELARAIHKSLNADPAVPGLRVPTVFCPTDGVSPPPEYVLDDAECSFVVVLADSNVVDRDSEQERKWSVFIGDLWEQCQNSPHFFFPAQLQESAWGFDDRLTGTSFIRAFAELDQKKRNALIIRRLVINLCRKLQGSPLESVDESPAPIKLFLSHTKLDIDLDPKVMVALNNYLMHDQPVRAWVDSGDIAAGSPFAKAIERGIKDSSLLCILTDNYSSREWCRKEIILAKLNQRPVVVVTALSQQEVRSFPYLGNVPVWRWPLIPVEKDDKEKAAINLASAVAAVDLLLMETLRYLHATALLKQTAKEGDILSARPPELLSLLHVKGAKTVLYPDPPLGQEELDILNETSVLTTTPLSRMAEMKPLKGKKIALSMSESTDIFRYGFDEIHLKEAMIELSRYLLIKGVTLVYGGHLGDEGYTQLLFELVRAHHNIEGMTRMERILNTIGWPLPYNQDLVANYNNVAHLKRILRPDDLNTCPGLEIADDVEVKPFPADRTPESRYCWARGMTTMREAQVAKDSGITARIILGGKFGPPETGLGSDEKWYAGRIPGVIEEVILSIQTGQPIFIIGAFGGAAALAIDLIEGNNRKEMSWDYQRRAPNAEAMRKLYDQCAQPWLGYQDMIELLNNSKVTDINPLLSDKENRELYHTRDIMRIIELILVGLNQYESKAE